MEALERTLQVGCCQWVPIGAAHLWIHDFHCKDTDKKVHRIGMADYLAPQGIHGHLHNAERASTV